MKSRHSNQKPQGPSQRQLRAGELIRHALVEVLREEEIHDEALEGVSVTVTEVRMSPDLQHTNYFVEQLGAGLSPSAETGVGDTKAVVAALNHASRFLRGQRGRRGGGK